MSIVIKVKRIQKVFDRLEYEVTQLQNSTGINCLTSCGQCCSKPDIEASVLEFLPFAFQLFLEKRTTWYKEQLLRHDSPICSLFSKIPGLSDSPYIKGKCSQYRFRGLICRLFGYASVRDKHGQKRLSTCKLIKGTFPEAVRQLDQSGGIDAIPNFVNYYQKLAQIDFRLGQEFHPIDKAILRAIEEVELYYNYRHFPYHHRRKRANNRGTL